MNSSEELMIKAQWLILVLLKLQHAHKSHRDPDKMKGLTGFQGSQRLCPSLKLSDDVGIVARDTLTAS